MGSRYWPNWLSLTVAGAMIFLTGFQAQARRATYSRTTTTTTSTTQPVATVSEVSTSVSKDPLSIGDVQNVVSNLQSNVYLSNLYVDIRIYDSANQMLDHKSFSNVSLSGGVTSQFAADFSSSNMAAGTYNVQVGVWDQTTWQTYFYSTSNTYFSVVEAPPATPSVTEASSSLSKSSVVAGEFETAVVNFNSATNLSNLYVDIRVYDSANNRVDIKAFQNVSFTAGSNNRFQADFQISSSLPPGVYNVQYGVWDQTTWQTYYYCLAPLYFSVADSSSTTPTSPTTTTTTLASTTTTTLAPSTTTTTMPATSGSAIPANDGNIISNPGFESGDASWNTTWGGMSLDSSQPRSGSSAMRIAPNGGTDTSFFYQQLIPGQTYRATIYGKQTVANESGSFTVILRDASGVDVFNQTVPVTSTSYQAYSIDFSMSSNVKSAAIQFYKSGGSGSMYIDDVSVVSTSNPVATTYAQGSATPAGGLGFPFGSHKFSYVAGIRPTSVSQASQDALVQQYYDHWKSMALSTACGDYMVNFSHPEKYASVSEGIGYGMLLTVLMAGYDPNAKVYFDGLFRFARKHPAFAQDPNLMDWAVAPNCSSGGQGWAATDGDLDIAMALLMADRQWGSSGGINYMAEAVKTIRALKLIDFNYTGISLAKGQMHRTSDDMFSHFRAFKKATGDSFWDLAISKGQEALEVGQSYSSAGLMPGWLVGYDTGNVRPSPGGMIESSIEGDYDWNACRNPWRVGTDYVVSGDLRSKAILMKMMSFFQSNTGGNPANFQPGYHLDGSPLDTWGASPSFVGPATAGAMVDSSFQDFLNNLWSWNVAHPAGGYFDNELQLIPLIVTSGNWWQP